MSGTTATSDLELAVELDTGAGLLMLSLAQAILLFAVWITLWPTSFGFPTETTSLAAFAAFFLGGAICGFYLGFNTLSQRDPVVQ
jgi:ABC-type uncharacterized transport system permease subunit